MLAVCGGYQLLGRFYRDVSGAEQPGAGVLPLYTVAGETRMIGDCLLECELEPGVRRTLAGFENHAGPHASRGGRRAARPRDRGLRERRRERLRGLPRRPRASARTCTAPCSPATRGWPTGCSRRRSATPTGGDAPQLDPLADELEEQAHAVSAGARTSRGGK